MFIDETQRRFVHYGVFFRGEKIRRLPCDHAVDPRVFADHTSRTHIFFAFETAIE